MCAGGLFSHRGWSVVDPVHRYVQSEGLVRGVYRKYEGRTVEGGREGKGREGKRGAGGRVHTARHGGTLERFLHILSMGSISVQKRSRLFRDMTHTSAQKIYTPNWEGPNYRTHTHMTTVQYTRVRTTGPHYAIVCYLINTRPPP